MELAQSLEANLLQYKDAESTGHQDATVAAYTCDDTSASRSRSSRGMIETLASSFASKKRATTTVIPGLAGQRISLASQASCERAYWAIRNSQLYFALQNSMRYPTAQAYVERLIQEAAAVNRPVHILGSTKYNDEERSRRRVAVLTLVTKEGSSFHVAQELALLGMDLILLGNSQGSTKMTQIQEKIRREGARRRNLLLEEDSNKTYQQKLAEATARRIGKIYQVHYDPNLLNAVREAATQVKGILQDSNYQNKLDVLLHNPAGVVFDYTKTKDGIEANVGRNFVAPHVLTQELLPVLRSASSPDYKPRIIYVSSVGHCNGTDFDFRRFFAHPEEGGAPEGSFEIVDIEADNKKSLINMNIDMDATLTAAKEKMNNMSQQFDRLFTIKTSTEQDNQQESSTIPKPKFSIPSFYKSTTKWTVSSLTGGFSMNLNKINKERQQQEHEKQNYVPPTEVRLDNPNDDDKTATSKVPVIAAEMDRLEPGITDGKKENSADDKPEEIGVDQNGQTSMQEEKEKTNNAEDTTEEVDNPFTITSDDESDDDSQNLQQHEPLTEEDFLHIASEDETKPVTDEGIQLQDQEKLSVDILQDENDVTGENTENQDEERLIHEESSTESRIPTEDALVEEENANEVAISIESTTQTDDDNHAEIKADPKPQEEEGDFLNDEKNHDHDMPPVEITFDSQDEVVDGNISGQPERSKLATIANTTAFAQVKMYYRSKMASIADSIALAREEPTLAVLSVYPGSVESKKKRKALGMADTVYQTTFKAFNLNPSQAARSSLRAALDPDVDCESCLQNGVYLHCDGNPWPVDHPTTVKDATTGECYSLAEYSEKVRESVQKLCHKLIVHDF